ncbi:hypothetical protein HYZ98_05505 [Candidatus Peregrinibacteria bacterium]|nr:hypothetical protein [Candidatus Peregrinibacteria bacterium]
MINTFSTTGATSHSTLVSGLTNGATFSYYVRCTDGVGNKNTSDLLIEFSILGSATTGGPVPPPIGPTPTPTPTPAPGIPTPAPTAPPGTPTPAPGIPGTPTPAPTAPGTTPPAPPTTVILNEGSLIRGPDGIKVYIINAFGYKRHIFNPAVFGMYKHFAWEGIMSVSKEVLDSYTTSDLYRADGDPKVYSLEEVNEAGGSAMKHHLDMTAAQFTARAWNWNQVFIVNNAERDYYSTGYLIHSDTVIPY